MAILPIDLTSSRVLLVEDDTLAMDMARTALGALGITRITLAPGGAQARPRRAWSPPDRAAGRRQSKKSSSIK